MDISYDYYRIFYHAAKCRSFSKAAAALMCGQPNVTKAIANLEAQLGCALFLRTSRGAVLTPEGEKLYAHVAAACEQLAQGEKELLLARDLEEGAVSVGATGTALSGLLIPAMERFHREHPKIKLRIFSFTTAQALAALRGGTVDFCLMTTPLEGCPGFQITPVREYREILCAGGQYASLGGKVQDLSVLGEHPVVSLGRSTRTYELYSQFFLAHGRQWQADIEVSSADQLLPLIRRGLGIGFVAEFFLTEALASGEVVEIPLAEPLPRRQICLVEDRGRPLSIAAGRLVQAIQASPGRRIL